MKKVLMALMIFIFAAVISNAGALTIEAKGSYFYPTEQAFKEIYVGGLMFGGEISVDIWRNLGVWIGGYYFSRYGELTFTGEETSLQIMPLGGGLKYKFISGILSFYGGAGVNYFDYQESNVIGDVKSGAVGFVTKVGAYLEPVDKFIIDIFIEYSHCRITP
ncbi:MAG: hypothetical protein MUO43_17230, partial [Desulfobacterales bacterium]|nr:hypothetical protein [Desulfobacterales bacterium]